MTINYLPIIQHTTTYQLQLLTNYNYIPTTTTYQLQLLTNYNYLPTTTTYQASTFEDLPSMPELWIFLPCEITIELWRNEGARIRMIEW